MLVCNNMATTFLTPFVLLAQMFYLWPNRINLEQKNDLYKKLCGLKLNVLGIFIIFLEFVLLYATRNDILDNDNIYEDRFLVYIDFVMHQFSIFVYYFYYIYGLIYRESLRQAIENAEKACINYDLKNGWKFAKIFLFVGIFHVVYSWVDFGLSYYTTPENGLTFFMYKVFISIHLLKLYIISAFLYVYKKTFIKLNSNLSNKLNCSGLKRTDFIQIIDLIKKHFELISIVNNLGSILGSILVLFISAYIFFALTICGVYLAKALESLLTNFVKFDLNVLCDFYGICYMLCIMFFYIRTWNLLENEVSLRKLA